jgi:hypothetical protein
VILTRLKEPSEAKEESAMAELDKHGEREDWLRWAIEFMRRGLWLDSTIIVHGPHSPYSFVWSEADAQLDGENHFVGVKFRTSSNIRNKYDVRVVRIWENDRDRQTFAIMKKSALTPKARHWLETATKTLARLRAERRRAC